MKTEKNVNKMVVFAHRLYILLYRLSLLCVLQWLAVVRHSAQRMESAFGWIHAEKIMMLYRICLVEWKNLFLKLFVYSAKSRKFHSLNECYVKPVRYGVNMQCTNTGEFSLGFFFCLFSLQYKFFLLNPSIFPVLCFVSRLTLSLAWSGILLLMWSCIQFSLHYSTLVAFIAVSPVVRRFFFLLLFNFQKNPDNRIYLRSHCNTQKLQLWPEKRVFVGEPTDLFSISSSFCWRMLCSKNTACDLLLILFCLLQFLSAIIRCLYNAKFQKNKKFQPRDRFTKANVFKQLFIKQHRHTKWIAIYPAFDERFLLFILCAQNFRKQFINHVFFFESD